MSYHAHTINFTNQKSKIHTSKARAVGSLFAEIPCEMRSKIGQAVSEVEVSMKRSSEEGEMPLLLLSSSSLKCDKYAEERKNFEDSCRGIDGAVNGEIMGLGSKRFG